MEEITFKNFYTAYLSVRLLRRSPGQDATTKWSTALRDLPLMDNPHTEGGSQDYYSIHRTQVGQTQKFCWNRSWSVSFIYSQVSASSAHKPADLPSVVCVQMQVAPDHVTCVRLILRQPSSAWTSFSLENIQIHPQRDQVGSAGAAARGTRPRRRHSADTIQPSVTGRTVRVGRLLSARQLHKLTRNKT